ncbi:MAG: hypothetical protein PVI01_15395 [Gemmatimonadales bacterium]|jgi:hypothetical protein
MPDPDDRRLVREEFWPGARWCVWSPDGRKWFTQYEVRVADGMLYLEGQILTDPPNPIPRDAVVLMVPRGRWNLAARVNFEEVGW